MNHYSFETNSLHYSTLFCQVLVEYTYYTSNSCNSCNDMTREKHTRTPNPSMLYKKIDLETMQ